MKNVSSISTKAVFSLIAILTCCKLTHRLCPERISWHINTYTNWNVSFFVCRLLLNIRMWDPFIYVNSIAVFVSYRTAFALGLDDKIREKVNGMGGHHMTRREFVVADFCLHSLPVILSTYLVLYHKHKVSLSHSCYAIVLSLYFAFIQVGKLDAGDIYVPHSWKTGWTSFVLTAASAPTLMTSLQANEQWKTAATLLVISGPYIFIHFRKPKHGLT